MWQFAYFTEDIPEDGRRAFLALSRLWGPAVDYRTGEVFSPRGNPLAGPLGVRDGFSAPATPEPKPTWTPRADTDENHARWLAQFALEQRRAELTAEFSLAHPYDGCMECLIAVYRV